ADAGAAAQRRGDQREDHQHRGRENPAHQPHLPRTQVDDRLAHDGIAHKAKSATGDTRLHDQEVSDHRRAGAASLARDRADRPDTITARNVNTAPTTSIGRTPGPLGSSASRSIAPTNWPPTVLRPTRSTPTAGTVTISSVTMETPNRPPR